MKHWRRLALLMSRFSLLAGMAGAVGPEADLGDSRAQVAPGTDSLGYPSRAGDCDVRPGFQNPPPGYGEVPFWWWSGDTPDAERLIAQVRELHAKGVSGVQVNYSHFDTSGWLTDQDPPEIFSEAWWDVYRQVSQVCGELNMGIGLSTYTLDWPRGAHNLFYKLFYSHPEWNARQLEVGDRKRVRGGETISLSCPEDLAAIHAYPVAQDTVQQGGVELMPFVDNQALRWTVPDGEWEVWTFRNVRVPGSLNPLLEGAGETVIRGFFQQFEDHSPDHSAKVLNYFFNDELQVGVGKFAWNPDFAAEFLRRKGYDLLAVLPAMWQDLGPVTPKLRMDYADVRMSLMEERYFRPVYRWHVERGLIFACDSGGRGRRPDEFGDYFRATRWYTAPGHDTPGGRADIIKGKVSSSIANLYQRPRVWLEGYHSLGWGATPEQIMFATRENYLYGCTLLNLHGLYYSTYGSHWEWAPPCYHFRMPYWEHMRVFLRYFERLSYLLSQGHLVADVAVVYPVAPYEAEMAGDKARDTAFDLAQRLMAAGISFEFIDHQSLARAVVKDGRLMVPGPDASYQALVFPNMAAVRWTSLEQAAAFAAAGGQVYTVGAVPTASDRAGREDAQLAERADQAFRPDHRLPDAAAAVTAIRAAFVQDASAEGRTVRSLHRRAGGRDVYLVMDAAPGTVVDFRAHGAVELWDPWTGDSRPLRVVAESATGTRVELPLEAYEAQVVVFAPGQEQRSPAPPDERPERQKVLPDTWTASFVPTMDNSQGDFRLPVTEDNRTIGVEARRFAWQRGTEPPTDATRWESKLHGYGTRFYVLGPLPDSIKPEAIEPQLAQLRAVDPSVPVSAAGQEFLWHPYDFSWRDGKENDPGHQGYHGLKRTITDDFLCLGKPTNGLNETRYLDEEGGNRYYVWTCAEAAEPLVAMILAGSASGASRGHTSPDLVPAVAYVNGKQLPGLAEPVALQEGRNPLLVRYDHAGRGHLVMRRASAPPFASAVPLAMRWYGDPARIPFSVSAVGSEWYRFVSAPGTKAIRVQALGQVQAWLDGEPMVAEPDGRFVVPHPAPEAPTVMLRVVPAAGCDGGGAISEPIAVETDGSGHLRLGDWSQVGILNNYSGGVRYRLAFDLTDEEARGTVSLDLGRVAATAEVRLNGEDAGVRVAPPWHFDVTGKLRPGPNVLEVLVFNTLANHYQTIPSRYRGNPVSGLFGPVRLLSRDWPVGELATAGDPAKTRLLASTDRLRVTVSADPLEDLDQRIRAKHNLALQPALLTKVTANPAHAGGGKDLLALFNGTAGNRQGTEATQDDGHTFVGFAKGNTLEIVFDPQAAPHGVRLEGIATYAGHHDARASQHYTVVWASVAEPTRFVELSAVRNEADSGLSEVAIRPVGEASLAQNVRALRFVFADGPLGFNVYREIAILGTIQ